MVVTWLQSVLGTDLSGANLFKTNLYQANLLSSGFGGTDDCRLSGWMSIHYRHEPFSDEAILDIIQWHGTGFERIQKYRNRIRR